VKSLCRCRYSTRQNLTVSITCPEVNREQGLFDLLMFESKIWRITHNSIFAFVVSRISRDTSTVPSLFQWNSGIKLSNNKILVELSGDKKTQPVSDHLFIHLAAIASMSGQNWVSIWSPKSFKNHLRPVSRVQAPFVAG